MNIDYCHHDTKTLNENYLKVIEGSSMYYEWYVKHLQQELQRKDNNWNELKEWTNSEIKRLEKNQNDKKYVKPYGQEYNNFTLLIGAYDNVLDKIKELEEK